VPANGSRILGRSWLANHGRTTHRPAPRPRAPAPAPCRRPPRRPRDRAPPRRPRAPAPWPASAPTSRALTDRTAAQSAGPSPTASGDPHAFSVRTGHLPRAEPPGAVCGIGWLLPLISRLCSRVGVLPASTSASPGRPTTVVLRFESLVQLFFSRPLRRTYAADDDVTVPSGSHVVLISPCKAGPSGLRIPRVLRGRPIRRVSRGASVAGDSTPTTARSSATRRGGLRRRRR